ncbi:TPR [Cordylochernes scorpioides]|uniref:Nucleoprotein TPR n=1 Tax=Cordylochernes scorpioides TaxID=51811 RepID=A0ABY6L7L3_9ARAC|nr:TPR [Cordylochernes scorpioides]
MPDALHDVFWARWRILTFGAIQKGFGSTCENHWMMPARRTGEKVKELLQTLEELHTMLRHSREEMAQLEDKSREEVTTLQSKLAESAAEVDKLAKELSHANTLLETVYDGGAHPCAGEEGLKQMFPEAAATSKLLAGSGLSLTQLYSQYLQSQEDLRAAKSENSRLSNQLAQIIAEVEEKTPLINQHYAEHQKALETVSSLQNQLSRALEERERLALNLEEALRARDYLERKESSLQQKVNDLNAQLQCLMVQVEGLRGGVVPLDGPSSPSPEDQISPGNAIISKHLVTFKDMEELLKKNQQLLGLVRDLTTSQEELEKQLEESKSESMAQLKSQLQQLQEERSKQVQMVESLVQQRDLYRQMASEKSPRKSVEQRSPARMPVLPPPVAPVEPSSVQEHLNKVQEEFDLYKKEKAENTRVPAVYRLMTEQLDTLRKECSDMRTQNARLTSQVVVRYKKSCVSQLEYGEERYKQLQRSMESHKKEAVFLQGKNSKMLVTLNVHQETIKNLRQELLSCHEKLAVMEVTMETLRNEKERLKASEKRVQHELEVVQREQVQFSKLSIHMQSVQANLERLESQSARHSAEQKDKAEQEVAMLRNKLTAEEEKLKTTVQVWESRVKEIQTKLDAEIKSGRQTHDELVEAYAQVHDLKLQLAELKAKSTSPIAGQQKETSAAAPLGIQHQIKTLRTQLTEVENNKKVLEDQVDSLKKSNTHYQQLSEELEGRLKEQTELCKELQRKGDQLKDEAKQEIERLEAEMEQLQSEDAKIRESNNALHKSQDEKVKELEQELTSIRQQHEECLKELTDLRQSSAQALQDAKEKSTQLLEDPYLPSHLSIRFNFHFARICNEAVPLVRTGLKRKDVQAQEKYERELVLHAQAIEQTAEVKKKDRALQESQSQTRQAQQVLQDKMEAWGQREAALMEEAEAVTKRCENLVQQNNHLHQQLELVSSQMAAMNSKDWSKLETQGASQHLQEVVNFLRREKDIADARSDTLQKENSRLQSKTTLLEQRVEDLAKELEEERHQAQTTCVSAEHCPGQREACRALKKVEMLNLLSDSNRLLRAEAEEKATRLTDLEHKLHKTQEELEPLKKANSELKARNDALAADQTTLRAEIDRWQTRVTALIEQSPTAEDIRNLTQEKEEMQTKLAALQAESVKKQSELSASLLAARQEMEAERAAFEATKKKLVQEKENAEKASKEQGVETEKKLTQIKKIARKYKAQFDALKDEQGQAFVGHESTITNLEEQLSSLQALLKDSEEAKQSLTEEIEKLKLKVQELSQQEEASKASLEKEKDKLRRLMQKKMTDLTKEKKALVNTLKSQYEGKLSKLDKDFKSARDNADKLEKQLEELKEYFWEHYDIFSHSRELLSFLFVRIDVGDRVERVSEPLTANIKPTTVAATLRYSNPPTPRTTPTASIRPLAIGTTPSTSRMAAVPPTPSEVPPAEVSSTPIPVISLYSGDVSGSEGTPSSSTEVNVVSTVSAASGDHSESPSSTSVIVVPLPQTQVVMPTVKRPREELPSTSEQDSKRMRMELQPAAIIQQQQQQPTQQQDDSTVESSKKASGGETSTQPPTKSSDSLEEEAMSDEEEEEEEEEEKEEPNEGEEDTNEALSPQAPEDPKPQETMEVEAGQEEDEEEEEEDEEPEAAPRVVAPRQNLAPFHIPSAAAPPSSFEEGDDSIVPSTPTLFVPRRGDGFAEAVSSPQVSRFMLFNPEAPSQSGLSQLASQGGVDDTRMDLSQYDGGRSVPTTPVQVSPQTEGQDNLQAADSPLMEECTGQDDPVPSLSEAESLEDPQRAAQEDSQPEPSEGSTLTEVTSSAPEGKWCSSPVVGPLLTEAGLMAAGSSSEAKAEDSQDDSNKPAAPRKPIVWKEPDTSSGPSTSFGVPPPVRGRVGPRIRKIQNKVTGGKKVTKDIGSKTKAGTTILAPLCQHCRGRDRSSLVTAEVILDKKHSTLPGKTGCIR